MTSGTMLDPICDMIVELSEARDQGLTIELGAREFAFCAHGCLVKFAKSPQAYIPKVDAWLAQQHSDPLQAVPSGERAPVHLEVRLLKDNATYSVRYACACGCNPQVKLQAAMPAAHEHCCCGIAHAAGADARQHLEAYLADRKASGEDAGRSYAVTEVTLTDPWGAPLSAAYAIPSPTA
jgi:YHS domain-containing protein